MTVCCFVFSRAHLRLVRGPFLRLSPTSLQTLALSSDLHSSWCMVRTISRYPLTCTGRPPVYIETTVVEHMPPLVCVCVRACVHMYMCVCAIQGSGLEVCLQLRVWIRGGVCNSGVWIRGVSAIQGSGLEGCLQFRGLD